MEKWPFLDQNHGLTPLEKCQISTFWTSFLYNLERRFFVLEYRKGHFPMLYCLKKRWKEAIFGPKPWIDPLWKKINFSTFWTTYFYSLERCFLVLEYRKRHFPGLCCVKKKRVAKMATFGPKAWVNPFGKMSSFPLFEIDVL